MKLFFIIALISIVKVKGRILVPSDEENQQDDGYPQQSGGYPQQGDGYPQQGGGYAPQYGGYVQQDDPGVAAVGLGTEGQSNVEQMEELVRVPRQHPHPYDGGSHPYDGGSWTDNPSSRTIGVQKNIGIGLGGGFPMQALPQMAPMAHMAPMMPPVPPPVHYQSIPYVAGYSLTPVYSMKQIPVAAPCPHMPEPVPYTIPIPAAPQLPGLYLNKQVSMGFGRSAQYDDNHHLYPHDYYYRSAEPHPGLDPSSYYHNNHYQPFPYMRHIDPHSQMYSMEPSNIVPQSAAVEQPLQESADGVTQLKSEKDDSALTNAIS